MNFLLREQIIKHVFYNFNIIPCDFVSDKSEPLINKKYLLDETLPFELEDGNVLKGKVWGCKFSYEDQDLNILLGDCTLDTNTPEYALIVQLSNQPVYGCYLILTDHLQEKVDNEALIAYSLDGKVWLECNTFLQATFLSGMEQLKEFNFNWLKLKDYKIQYETLVSFIEFHNSLFEVNYAGTED